VRLSPQEKKGVVRETSLLLAELGDPGYYSADFVCFSGFSLAFPQEGKAAKRNERREKEGIAREKSPLISMFLNNDRKLHID
jgi:hypothetical protein